MLFISPYYTIVICFAVAEILALQNQARQVQLPSTTPVRRPQRKRPTVSQALNAAVKRKARTARRQQEQAGGFPYDDRFLNSINGHTWLF